jgi:streptomycin 6-kinase
LIIPDILRRHAAVAGAEAWPDELPAVVRHLEQRWNITVGGLFSGATEAYVVQATTVDGQAVVVKVLLPSNPNAARHEITALRLADGEGCVALLRDDPELGALLLERLGTSLFKLGLPVAQRLEILCDTVTRMWRAAPDCGLPTGADRARQRGVFIAEHGRSSTGPAPNGPSTTLSTARTGASELTTRSGPFSFTVTCTNSTR